MTKDELAYWLSVTESSRFKWTEDAIFRLNGRGSFYYTGGEDGIYMKIGNGGLLEAGTYEGAIPHIGEAMFMAAATKQYANYNDAFTAAMEAGGKQFLIDMFSADAPEAPEQKPIIRAKIANAGDMTSMFSDMNRLKAGDFMRAWHDFPTTKEEFQATLREIGIDSARRSDYVITGYETNVAGLCERLPFGADADEINYLAFRLQNEVMPDNLPVFEAVMQSGKHCDSLRNIINVTENLDCFYIQPAYSLKQYAEFLAETGRDEYADAIARLENTNEEGICAIPSYIDRLEKYFNAEA